MTEKEERRYSLGAPSNPREKNFTILHRKKFSLKRLERQQGMKVSLWNVSPPRWPGEANARMKPEELAILLKRAYDHSQERAHLVLWIPGPELHQTMLSPLDDVDPWMSQGTIFSGDKTGMNIGFVYAKGPTSIYWESKVLLDERGKRGAASSHAMRFILEHLLPRVSNPWVYDRHRIVDMFMHRSGQLPLWSRRCGFQYVGYTASKKTFAVVKEKLAQGELPGIQVPLPAT
jgi:hypothetical protein